MAGRDTVALLGTSTGILEKDTSESQDSNTFPSSDCSSSWIISNSSLPAVAIAEALTGSPANFCSDSAMDELKSSNGDFGRPVAVALKGLVVSTSSSLKGLDELDAVGLSMVNSTGDVGSTGTEEEC